MGMRRVYFIGIGGISMSGLAKYELLKGSKVFGSDIKQSETISELKKMGAKIFLGQRKENILNLLPLDLVVYSSAITPKSEGAKELNEAKLKGIKVLKRSEYIGEITKKIPTLAVCGMHGKTTTSAMLGQVLKDLGENPLVFLGGKYSGFNHKNIEVPKSKPKWFVAEACEYDKSFLDFDFLGAIILNIEEEHLDYFKGGLKQIIKTFRRFAQKKQGDFLIAHNEPNIKEALFRNNKKIVYYSEKELKKEKIILKIPGQHNQLNALAVIKLVRALGLNEKKARLSLSNFCGVERRQEFKGEYRKLPVFDDYGHHPTEIRTTLKAMRESYPDRRIFLVFQPHQYMRTTLLFPDFVKSLALADKLVLIKVYKISGRESIKNPKTSKDLYRALEKQKPVFYAKDYQEAEQLVKSNLAPSDLLLFMSAGPVYEIAEKLVNNN